MTEVTPVKVIHCSSQDTVATAENLLNTDADKPWKSKSYGEKQIIVTLQFEKPEQIHAVEIQNNGSAFVEVLGGNVKSFDQDYEVICAMSFFMSPGESKRAQNTDRVRIFGPEKLCRPAADKQFETVKIVCTQPYTKNLKFGLACIKFYSPPEPGTKWTGPSTSHLKDSPRGKKLAGFKIKEEDESEDIKPGALFFGKSSPPDHDSPKAKNSGPSCTTPTLTTEQSESPEGSPSAKQLEFSGSKQFSNKTNSGKRKADHTGETTPKKQRTTPPSAKKDAPESSPKTKGGSSAPLSPGSLKAGDPWPAKGSRKDFSQPFTKQPTPVKHSSASQGTSGASRGPEGGGKAVEFGQLLRGVAFVLSGFQNPFRSDLRDKALALGAKYMPDWTDSSTHLICAFANTPKYNQVKSQGGIIVSKEWILDCYKRRQKLSHKRYLFDGASSEEEDDDEVETTAGKESSSSTPVKKHANGQGTSQKTAGIHKEAESDEDEKRGHQETEEDIYDASTDENTDTEENGAKSSKSNGDESDEKEFPIPELPDFFTGKHFYFYGNFPGNERRTLCRYVVAFNGLLEDYMNERVNFVVSAQEWDDNFYDALTENPNLAFVKPQWIYSCNSKGKRLPHQPFVVIPQE